jgi:hypothetical protein
MDKLAKAVLRVIGVVGLHQERLDELELRVAALENKESRAAEDKREQARLAHEAEYGMK